MSEEFQKMLEKESKLETLDRDFGMETVCQIIETNNYFLAATLIRFK